MQKPESGSKAAHSGPSKTDSADSSAKGKVAAAKDKAVGEGDNTHSRESCWSVIMELISGCPAGLAVVLKC